ncbi:MAG: hypothetical protein QF486_05115 [Candidatus Woesearchaeota archaeon]|jgi:ligand-binding sensor domain-containing protein|nr:hypothetical protein [Candidatus Woesearchaeota archaeon]MDP7198968.1 hypothetical protein [Candidatus Woesearchaeota archaeon]MDP7467348.1 hypothetical protein [Candidatus Woesearchaeota archaeon]MDP7646598.1 hypothetical protein [Candidatus Woesearchaeota archaeon]|tara:strand:+ start:159 stop:455 length:297 start_codon:yes stop_codon:yes gene_type:complete
MRTLQPIDVSQFIPIDDAPETVVGKTIEVEDGLFGDLSMWNQQNGVLTFVDDKSRQYVAFDTTARRQLLAEAGYERDEQLWVLHSNDGRAYLREHLSE